MAHLIKFTEKDFAHLPPEEWPAVKRVVYKKDFQEIIVNLRDKHHIPPFEPVPDFRKCEDGSSGDSPLLRPVGAWFLHYNFDTSLARDIEEVLREKVLPVGWAFMYIFTKFNHLLCVDDNNHELNVRPPTDKELKWFADQFTEIERQDAAGEEGAEKKLEWLRYSFCHGRGISAETRGKNVVVTISPEAKRRDIKKVIDATKPFRRFFKKTGQEKTGSVREDLLDEMNYAIMLHREGKSDREISSELQRRYEEYLRCARKEGKKAIPKIKRQGDFSLAGVRKLTERAKKLGF